MAHTRKRCIATMCRRIKGRETRAALTNREQGCTRSRGLWCHSSYDYDAKKQAYFKRGLNPKLKDRLATARAANYNVFANMAITQEDATVDLKAHKKRKAPSTPISGAPPPYRMVPSAS